MHLATKEQLQEIREALDEYVVWEYLRLGNEIKLALLGNNLANAHNLDEVLAEYIRFEYEALRDEADDNEGEVYEK